MDRLIENARLNCFKKLFIGSGIWKTGVVILFFSQERGAKLFIINDQHKNFTFL